MKIKKGGFVDKVLIGITWPETYKREIARNKVIDEVKEKVPKKYHKTLEDMKR